MRLCESCGTPVPYAECPHCGEAEGPSTPAWGGLRRARGAAATLGLVVSTVVFPGCATSMYGLIAVPIPPMDQDQDGWTVPQDCDDADPDVNPGAAEAAGDGVDSDCDGLDDPQA